VAEKEGIKLPKKAALQISKDSLGHPRNALKILQKIMHCDPDDMLEIAKQEAERREQAISLCRKLMGDASWADLAKILKSIDEEPETVRRTVRSYFTTVLLGGNESAYLVLDAFSQPLYSTDARNELVKCTYEAFQALNE
jgi:hypothetical protein